MIKIETGENIYFEEKALEFHDELENVNNYEKNIEASEQIKILLYEGYGLAGSMFEGFYSNINGKMVVMPQCPVIEKQMNGRYYGKKIY